MRLCTLPNKSHFPGERPWLLTSCQIAEALQSAAQLFKIAQMQEEGELSNELLVKTNPHRRRRVEPQRLKPGAAAGSVWTGRVSEKVATEMLVRPQSDRPPSRPGVRDAGRRFEASEKYC